MYFNGYTYTPSRLIAIKLRNRNRSIILKVFCDTSKPTFSNKLRSTYWPRNLNNHEMFPSPSPGIFHSNRQISEKNRQFVTHSSNDLRLNTTPPTRYHSPKWSQLPTCSTWDRFKHIICTNIVLDTIYTYSSTTAISPNSTYLPNRLRYAG